MTIALWKKLLYAGLVMLGLLLILEAGLRLSGYTPAIANTFTLVRHQSVANPFPGVPYLYAPHTTVELRWSSNPREYFDKPGNTLSIPLNNYGFRGKDLAPGRSPAIRTVFLGDSFAWGWGVKDDDVFTAVLAAELARSASGQPLEFDNLGVPGFDTQEEVALFEHVGLGLEPDVAVLWFFLNDFGGGLTVASLGQNDRFHTVRHWSRLMDLLLAPIDGAIGESRLIGEYRSAFVEGSPGWLSIKAGLERFSRLCREHHVVPVIVIHPVLMRLDAYPFADVHRTVLELAKQSGVVGIDLLPSLAGERAGALWVHPSDQHPNEIAHRLAARFLAPRLSAIIETTARARRRD